MLGKFSSQVFAKTIFAKCTFSFQPYMNVGWPRCMICMSRGNRARIRTWRTRPLARAGVPQTLFVPHHIWNPKKNPMIQTEFVSSFFPECRPHKPTSYEETDITRKQDILWATRRQSQYKFLKAVFNITTGTRTNKSQLPLLISPVVDF
jgi:hypothetical protein